MCAFTLIELVVVITIIIIVLAVAVPGLSAMNAEARMTAASQITSGVLTRAYYLAIGDVNLTAVRFLPAEWDSDPNVPESVGRQHLAIYRYAGLAYNPNTLVPGGPGANLVQYNDFFVRRDGVDSVTLPVDVWAAPVEALSKELVYIQHEKFGGGSVTLPGRYRLGRDFVLDGQIGDFNIDAGSLTPPPLLNADDFLIVIDPKTGVYGGVPRPFRMRAYSPTLKKDVDVDTAAQAVFQRYSFSGVTFYRRAQFKDLSRTFSGADLNAARQDWLQGESRPFVAQRYSAHLSPVSP